MKMEGLVKSILDELSCHEAFRHVEYLTSLGIRLAGTREAELAADYIKTMMDGYGLETELSRFQVYNSYPGDASLEVIVPICREAKCRGYAHIEPTPPEGIEGELTYVKAGREEDYEGLDVAGKIVLTEMRYGLARPEKARIAVACGAVGMIVIDLGTQEHQVISNGAMKGVWGNPTPNTSREIPKIAAVGVPKGEGKLLKGLLAEHDRVTVRLKTECERAWQEVTQPIGRIVGTTEPERFVLVAGHFESWGPGATDNAAGNGLMLELARVLSRHRDKLRRSVVFAFWNGHEIAEASGSTWFADNFWDEIRDGAVAHINIDQPGLRGTDRFQVLSTLDLKEFAVRLALEVLDEPVIYDPLRGKYSDQSFYGAGIPSLLGGTVFSDEDLERMDGASLGWWWHTEEDTLDKVDVDVLGKSMKVFAAYIVELCNADPLPLEFITPSKVILGELKALRKEVQGQDTPIALDPLLQTAERLEYLAEKLKDYKKGNHGERINLCLTRLSRKLLPILHISTCKYEQDSYGLSELQHPLPSLYPLFKLAKMDKGSAEYEMLLTHCVRERNRISDLLKEAVELLEGSLADGRVGRRKSEKSKGDRNGEL